jgi:hypothetical protein
MSDVISAFDIGTHNMDDWEGGSKSVHPEFEDSHLPSPSNLESRCSLDRYVRGSARLPISYAMRSLGEVGPVIVHYLRSRLD